MKHIQRNGSVIDFTKKVPDMNFEDLLYSLAHERRFSGRIPWTVLQHSIMMGRYAKEHDWSKDLVSYCYLHDVHEALVRDVPTPFKQAVGKPWYDMEHSVQKKVLTALGKGNLFKCKDNPSFKELDFACAYFEACRFFPKDSDIIGLMDAETHWLYSLDLKKIYGQISGLNIVDEHGEVYEKWLDEMREALK